MTPLILSSGDPAGDAELLQAAWERQRPVALAAAGERSRLEDALAAGHPDHGAAVILGSGGSTGGRQWCLQPLAHLEASADATGRWLVARGIDPAACVHLNPLPLLHVSGLLPLVRCRRWGAQLRWMAPELMRDPARLAEAVPLPGDRPALLSLVPTQLARLLARPEGVAWLAGCRLIWVGGASLPPALADAARAASLPLAPCYGATETAAMVCVQRPAGFLAGMEGCGQPLDDVALRVDPTSGAIEVRTARLSPGRLTASGFLPLPLQPGGWWRSGDAGRLAAEGLQVLGRLDGALLSGGETVFPERLEERLREAVAEVGLPLEALLLLGEADAEWGERLVALVRPVGEAEGAELVQALQAITATWPPSERPRRWLYCPDLEPGAAGKWQRQRWRQWLKGQRLKGQWP